jgi:hypothetical protein
VAPIELERGASTFDELCNDAEFQRFHLDRRLREFHFEHTDTVAALLKLHNVDGEELPDWDREVFPVSRPKKTTRPRIRKHRRRRFHPKGRS